MGGLQVELGEMGYTREYSDDWRKPVLVRGEDRWGGRAATHRFGHLNYWATKEVLLEGRAGGGVPHTAQ